MRVSDRPASIRVSAAIWMRITDDIYRSVSAHPGVKKVFVASGIRYDLLVGGSSAQTKENHCEVYIRQLVEHHVSGRLKVAPEHTADRVLTLMRKPKFGLFRAFKKRFEKVCQQAGLTQQLIPYFISSHPGSRLEDMAELACQTREEGLRLEQVQDFTPTPMTLATVIYYSGYHPYTMEEIPSPRGVEEKRDQKRFFFWYKKENWPWIRRTLQQLGQAELADRLLGGTQRRGGRTGKKRK